MGDPQERRGHSAWLWAVLALLALELVATGLDVYVGPYDHLHWEEAINARAGVLIACGHLDRIWDLQYQPFCGGCTADALLSAGLFSVLPPTVQTFKLIPAALHVALLVAGAALAWRAAGARGALAFLAPMLGSPAVFRQLSLIGWGNHAESMVFSVLAAWLLVRGAASPRAPAWAGAAGLVAGLGAWYCYTSAHALPVLLVLALWRPRGWTSGAAFVLGTALGLGPWWAYLAHRPDLLGTLAAPAAAHALPGLGEFVRFVAGRELARALWPTLPPGQAGALWGATYWYGLWALALGGVLAAALVRGREPLADAPHARRGAALYPPLALGALLAAYAWRHGAWYGPSDRLVTNFLGLRYLSPLLPTLALCAAAAQAAVVWRPLRAAALIVALGLGAGGLALRTLEWHGAPDRRIGRSVCERDAPSGPSAFPGAAPALVAHLAEEPDEPRLCRRDHLIELAGVTCAGAVVPPLAADVLAAVSDPAEAQSFLDPCLQQAWGNVWRAPGGCSVATFQALLARSCDAIGQSCAAWRPEVATSLLRAAPWECIKRGLDPRDLEDDPDLHAAWCRLRGEDSVLKGHKAPVATTTTLRCGPACAGEASFAYGAGRAWAKRFGCGAGARAAWEDAGGP
ncbi:MAG: hypothetical protein ABIO70_09275, partial [Pseudomonadota bacterium]